MKMKFMASSAPRAQAYLRTCLEQFGQSDSADVIVAIGGDGFMLDVLRENFGLPVYGVNMGTVGFLMNDVEVDDLPDRIACAQPRLLPVLSVSLDGAPRGFAINDIALLRARAQAAHLRISVNEEVRMERLMCDGVLVATPAGSTAYNASLGGPILPLGANVLALTPMAPFRPRRWRGAVLPVDANIGIEALDCGKRPVMVSVDGQDLGCAQRVDVAIADRAFEVLFDAGHSLERRILDEQFT